MPALNTIVTRVCPSLTAAIVRCAAGARQATREALGECDLRWLLVASLLCAALLRAACR